MSALICYDDSPSARHALKVASVSLGGAPAVLVHVWNEPERVIPDAFGIDRSEHGLAFERLEELARQRADEILARGQGLANTLGLSVTTRAEPSRSTVAQTILDVADELSTDLVVCGTHGATAVSPGLLGSVSNVIVHAARRPVLVVPGPAVAAP